MINVFTGSRRLEPHEEEFVRQEVELTCILGYDIYVGDCPTGVDAVVRQAVTEQQGETRMWIFEADWKTYGRSAGFWRNRAMLDAALDADDHVTVIGFPRLGGSDTQHCLKLAIDKGMALTVYPVHLIDPEDVGQ